MPGKNEIKKKVEETLNSLEGVQRATLSPFFFTRVQAAIERDNRNTWNMITSLIARPVVVTGGLLLVMLFNAVVLWQHVDTAAPATDQGKQVALADEYNLATTTVYDYENTEAR